LAAKGAFIALDMRGLLIGFALSCLILSGKPAWAVPQGKVIKVLPHFLDRDGRHQLTPDLYQRDAYQAFLRSHPESRSGIRYDIQWKSKGTTSPVLILRAELRGIAQGDFPRQLTLERTVKPKGRFSHWTGLLLTGEDYAQFGEVTAWRVTLWENGELLDEQRSFLW
jgi:hypothetical protein